MTIVQLTAGRRIAIAFFGSAAAVCSYFCTVTNGIVAGALIGLPNRVADVVVVERHARYWLCLAVLCQLLVIMVVSPLVPPEPSDDFRVLLRVCRLGISALLCVFGTLLLETLAFALITMHHHSAR
jgi:hypothetical protein